MERKTGVHFYINIKNLDEIIREEESNDEELKRTLHRLQTYFTGITKLIKDSNISRVEKYTSGRAHIVFELDENEEKISGEILETVCACYIYVNNIFNELGKYSQYTKFKVHGGIDYGDYYDYEINETDITSIGSVANLSAKIQSYASKNHLYASKKFIDKLDEEIKEKFILLSREDNEELYGKIKSNEIYDALYSNIFTDSKLDEIEKSLNEVKEKVIEESRKINLKDITFEGVSKRLSFENLSLISKNKKIEECIVICADIRGFTKLFNLSDSNLDALKDVMEEIYSLMGEVVNDFNGTLVQYQGDRLVAIYHDYEDNEDYVIRGLEAALTLKDNIIELSNDSNIKEKLNNRKISIGIGCSIGQTIATRLGLKGNKDNIILGESFKYADKAEDRYAEKKEVVIYKSLREKIELISKDEENENSKYDVLNDIFKSIKTTGYYKTDITLDYYVSKVKEREEEKEKINKMRATQLNNSKGVRPWSEI